ncbi:hypothetical protein BCR34DRAFT_328756 [Clohesyomyces aquaticus]|uniref:Uncharacterized protein n=1 Tax=Clohesyomyces aquaticus TaxID=1231657 RepID=A0A1Y1ZLS8_9PLEO|nr:hypothetical protein BCR34DRAFT_328756 [Clohesyomyces aquaticus]
MTLLSGPIRNKPHTHTYQSRYPLRPQVSLPAPTYPTNMLPALPQLVAQDHQSGRDFYNPKFSCTATNPPTYCQVPHNCAIGTVAPYHFRTNGYSYQQDHNPWFQPPLQSPIQLSAPAPPPAPAPPRKLQLMGALSPPCSMRLVRALKTYRQIWTCQVALI